MRWYVIRTPPSLEDRRSTCLFLVESEHRIYSRWTFGVLIVTQIGP